MRKQNPTVSKAIEAAGGAVRVSKMFNVTPEAVRQWALKGRRIPAECVLSIEAASGVSRHQLRPDVYGKER